MKPTYQNNLREKLDKFREFMKDNFSCVDVLQSQIEFSKNQLSGIFDSQKEDLGEVLVRTVSKDLSRYYDSYSKYLKVLAEMGTTDNLKALRKKIIFGDKNFFSETWKEDSDSFFRTRKFISLYIKDPSQALRINSSLDCIISGLQKYIYNLYGGWERPVKLQP